MAATIHGMTWWEYVRHIAGTEVQTAIADRTGIAQATISRWKLGRQSVDAPNAVAVARAFGRPATEALVVAGFLTEEEVDAQVTISRIEEPSNDELLDLLARRLRRDREEGEGSGQQPAATNNAGEASATSQGLTEEERAILMLARELDDSRTVGDLRSAAAGIAAGSEAQRGDYTLAAMDANADEEIESWQNEP